jgi:diadenosine tetraphosphate (Ap4A) HIT family hydrolase
MGQFVLDARLAADTLPVGDLDLSTLRLMNDRRYPWAILAPRRAGIVEFHELARADRRILAEEIAVVSEALARLAAAHKMNVAALGNQVRQLHVHVVARQTDDAAWPDPVFGSGAPAPYDDAGAGGLVARLQAAVGLKAGRNAL